MKRDEIFVVDVPELPGCMAHGPTKREAISNAEAAIDLWIATAKDDGIPIPEPPGQIDIRVAEAKSVRLD